MERFGKTPVPRTRTCDAVMKLLKTCSHTTLFPRQYVPCEATKSREATPKGERKGSATCKGLENDRHQGHRQSSISGGGAGRKRALRTRRISCCHIPSEEGRENVFGKWTNSNYLSTPREGGEGENVFGKRMNTRYRYAPNGGGRRRYSRKTEQH